MVDYTVSGAFHFWVWKNLCLGSRVLFVCSVREQNALKRACSCC